jgi:hypothetical protein
MTHGPPLAVPSCSPAVESSNFLTAQAPERVAPHGPLAADATGLVTLKVTCLVPGTTTQVTGTNAAPPCNDPGDQIDVKITSASTGVRCKGISGGCSAANALYTGKVLLRLVVRMTDRLNGPTNNPGTASDITLPAGIQCTSGACGSTTSADSVYPNLAREASRAVWQLGKIEVLDGGTDGDLAPNPSPASGVCPPACQGNGGETVFMTQGLFAP